MAAIGLLYVGAVLFVNGLVLTGAVGARAAGPLNVFVGVLQVITPTYLVFTSGGDAATLLGASGLYLFGFTYLYVAFLLFTDMDSAGFGYFALFVAICAVAYSVINFTRGDDPAFGVLWLHWSFLWVLFFLVFGLKRGELARYTGYIAAIEGWLTASVPGLLILLGVWGGGYALPLTIGFAALGIVGYPALYAALRRRSSHPEPAAAPSVGAEPSATTS
ncbi:AmiS/UreI family transporter [Pseudonocardia xishanensis]|uniref:AmiS/UreI family transporter n=1 Tax=Pseudonocardia xishanensis TaxID=630995 RepID=A0ABP8RZX3_9PSEU